MKLLLFAALVYCAHGLGEDHCTWGPSHWCSSLRTAKQCGAIEHCKDTVWSTTDFSKNTSEVCEFCENILGDVRKFLTDKQTEDSVRQYLDSACSMIPVSQLADQCKDTVDNDLDQLFDLIKSELDPKAICAAIGLCSGLEDHTLRALPRAELHRVALTKDTTNVVSLPKTQDEVCDDCKKLITDLKKQMTDNATESQVETMLKEQLCTQMGPLESECDTLVETYVPEIMDMLAQEMDPDMVCAALGLCANGDLSLLAKLKLRKSPLYKALSSHTNAQSDECAFCKIVFEELQDLDRSTALQKEVEDFVSSNFCAKLGSYKDVCDTTVQTYGQMIFELLATELDPDTRCKAFGFCTSGMPVAEAIRAAMPAKRAVKASPGCVLCEAVMMEIRTMLDNNQTEAEIVADLDKVCALMPASIKADCDDFINTYGPAVINLLLQELSPELVCTVLGLCAGDAPRLAIPKKAVESDEMCGICETVIQYLESVVAENATEQQIKKDLERICNFLPDTIKETCDDLVEQYMDMIIQLVLQGLTPKEVCAELNLCTKAKAVFDDFLKVAPVIVPQQVQMVGVNECTYGPSYWCASAENAKKCGATAHCEGKVWNKN